MSERRRSLSLNISGPRVGRRRFLRKAALAGGALAAAHVGGMRPALGQALLPPPEQSGIEHIVVVMMKNRSFDHMLGWVEGSDGRQQGLRYPDRTGELR